MKIVQNRSMISQLSTNILNNEMTDLALVLNSPTVLATYYQVDPNFSEVIKGYQNVTDYIGPESEVVYDRIEHLPLCGIGNGLLQNGMWNDEIGGFDEDFSTSCVVYPRTIMPKMGDCFKFEGVAGNPALYIVTNTLPSTVKTNPFNEITFHLLTRDAQLIDAIDNQVKNVYTTCMSAIGKDRSLVISKGASEAIDEHLTAYLELVYLYQMLFYDKRKSAFVFDGLPNRRGQRCTFIDMTLWKFMFDEGICIYDDLITYANNNGKRTVEKIYTSCPNLYIDEYAYRRSIIYRIYAKDDSPKVTKRSFDEYRFPQLWHPPAQVTKYQGNDIWYLECFGNHPCDLDPYDDFTVWDDDFICRIRENRRYDEVPMGHGVCTKCEHHCMGAPVLCFNPYLRNVIIDWWNGTTIDWEAIQVTDDRTIENYYLIPMVLGIYHRYIQGLADQQ